MNVDQSNQPSVSLVIPVCNEEENIETLYREIRAALDPLLQPYEIIFIDDGSVDKTFRILCRLKTEEKEAPFANTRIIKFSRNFGQTPAMQAGFDHARADTIVSLDGDLQNDPRDIPMLINKLDEGYDVVAGWRRDRQDKRMSRILPSKVANWLIARLTGVPIHDNGCSLKAYRREIFNSIRLYSDLHRFIPAISTLAGARIAEIVVNHRARKYGQTKYGLSRIFKVLADMISVKMVIHFRDRPLFLFGLISLPFILVGLGFAGSAFFSFFTGTSTVVLTGSAFLTLALAAYLVSWGILAEFLVKVRIGRFGKDK